MLYQETEKKRKEFDRQSGGNFIVTLQKLECNLVFPVLFSSFLKMLNEKLIVERQRWGYLIACTSCKKFAFNYSQWL